MFKTVYLSPYHFIQGDKEYLTKELKNYRSDHKENSTYCECSDAYVYSCSCKEEGISND